MVEVSAKVWESVARWLELTRLARTLWRLREPKPLSKAFATRNTRYIASALDRLRSVGFVREAVVSDTRYLYLTERACGLLALLGYSLEEAACGEEAPVTGVSYEKNIPQGGRDYGKLTSANRSSRANIYGATESKI